MMTEMSGLTKKVVYADKVLASLLGVSEGAHVSYAELSKGLHRYIKENDLKNPRPALNQNPPTLASPPNDTGPDVANAATKQCRDCGLEIPFDAVYCDLCGVQQ
jgi:hypothetical protein